MRCTDLSIGGRMSSDAKLSTNLFNIYLNIFLFESAAPKKARDGYEWEKKNGISKKSNLFRCELAMQTFSADHCSNAFNLAKIEAFLLSNRGKKYG